MKDIPIRHIHSYQNDKGFLSDGFNIRNVRDMLNGKNMIQELHRHDFFFFLALKHGSGNHIIDFTPYKIGNHSVFFLRPGQVHELKLEKGSSGFLMGFDKDFYFPRDQESRQLFRRVSSKNFYKLDANRFRKSLSILSNIFQEYSSKQEGYYEMIKASLAMLFIELIRQRQNSNSSLHNSDAYTQDRLEEFLELVEMHIAEHKQPSKYAAMLNISLYQLNTITKATLGKTSSEVINEYTILESKRYLLATADQVKKIALHLGYEDVSYFIRFFKKHTGYSPDAFRDYFK